MSLLFARYKPILLLLITLGFFSTRCIEAQKALSLKDGQEITVSGRLAVKGGWRRFLVVESGVPYRLEFGADSGGPAVSHEIAFYLPGHTEEIGKLQGQKVTVTGKLQLNEESPYYWLGTMIQAQSLQLPSGATLLAKKETSFDQPWPDGPATFVVAVTMIPNKLLPQYALIRPSDRSTEAPPGFSCGVNGGGDLLNCSCPKGYVGSRTGKIKAGHFVPLKTDTVIQLYIEQDSTRSITLAAECTREKHHREQR